MKKINKKKTPKEFEVRKAAIYATHRKIIAERENSKDEKFNAYHELTAADRAILRRALAQEQGYICVYCEKELTKEVENDEGNLEKLLKPNTELVIEHFRPESIYQGRVNTTEEVNFLCDDLEKYRDDLTLDYNNLFLSCNGHSGGKEHCDASKKNWDFCHLTNPSTWKTTEERKIFFTKNGFISSRDENIKIELEGKQGKNGKGIKPHYLNLNEQKLVELRKKTWVVLARRIAKTTGIKNWEKGGDEVLEMVTKLKHLYKNGKREGPDIHYKPFRSFILYNLERRFKGRL